MKIPHKWLDWLCFYTAIALLLVAMAFLVWSITNPKSSNSNNRNNGDILVWEVNGKTNVMLTVTNQSGNGWTTADVLYDNGRFLIVSYKGTNIISSDVFDPSGSKPEKGYLGTQSLGQKQRTK